MPKSLQEPFMRRVGEGSIRHCECDIILVDIDKKRGGRCTH